MKQSDIKYFLTIYFLTETTQKCANFVDALLVHHVYFTHPYRICREGIMGKNATLQVPGHEQGLDSPPRPGKKEPAVTPSLLLFRLMCWRQVGALQGGCKATQAPRGYYG